MQETVPNFTQGDLQQTSQSTDIALMEQNMPTKEGGLFLWYKALIIRLNIQETVILH